MTQLIALRACAQWRTRVWTFSSPVPHIPAFKTGPWTGLAAISLVIRDPRETAGPLPGVDIFVWHGQAHSLFLPPIENLEG